VKPAPFTYHAPATVAEAAALLGEDAKVLAGGQSLVPAMNFRLARPATIVDINRIRSLDRIDVGAEIVTVGAMTRHRRFEEPIEPGPLGRLLAMAAHKIGHLPIRVRGTMGGSLAHADPAAEWCSIFRVLDGRLVATGPEGSRVIEASGFFDTVFTTAIRPDELIETIELPRLADSYRVGFAEFSRRAGDFALVMAAVVLDMDGETVRTARLVVGGAADVPIRLEACEAALAGQSLTSDTIGEIADLAAESVTPLEDIHASVEYRRDLIRAMTRRAMAGAT